MSGIRKNVREFIRETKESLYFAWKYNKGMFLKAGVTVVIVIVSLVLFLHDRASEEVPIIEENSDITNAVISEESLSDSDIDAMPSNENSLIYVDVAGAVTTPGVVEIRDGSRVFEAIKEAGGILPDADTTNINLAAILKDGDKLFVPTFNEMKKDKTTGGIVTDKIASKNNISNSTGSSGGMVNINTASSEELQTLSGIGPSTADKIIDYRNSHGIFSKIEDIKKVSGIGEKTFLKFKDKICI